VLKHTPSEKLLDCLIVITHRRKALGKGRTDVPIKFTNA
jgi:hypothetical protein